MAYGAHEMVHFWHGSLGHGGLYANAGPPLERPGECWDPTTPSKALLTA